MSSTELPLLFGYVIMYHTADSFKYGKKYLSRPVFIELVDQFRYLGKKYLSNVSKLINKLWVAIHTLTTIWTSNFSYKIKREFF